jgi:hypothetical protein
MPLQFLSSVATTPAGLELACARVAEVLSFQAANGGPVLDSRELEYASRRLARTAQDVGLPGTTVVTWLIISGAVAFGRTTLARSVMHRATEWAFDELNARRPAAVAA